MSAVVSPASAMAARHASSVSSNGSRPRRRPMSDCPTPLMQVRRSMMSFASMPTSAPSGSNSGIQTSPSGSGWCSNVTRSGMPICHRVGLDVHEVRGEPHARLLDDLDDRDDVRQLRPRHPRLVVDRVGRERRLPRDRFGSEVLRVAHGADRLRRVDVVAVVLAAPEDELAPLAALPEAAVVIGELRQDAERHLGRPPMFASVTRLRSSAPRRSPRARTGSPAPRAAARRPAS